MHSKKLRKRFESVILVHLGQAYNLAMWLLHDSTDAEDIVQQSCIRAYKGFSQFRNDNAAGWFLTIVRNTSYNHLKQKQKAQNLVSFDEMAHSSDESAQSTLCTLSLNPEQLMEIGAQKGLVKKSMSKLSPENREIIYLREIAGYSYKEIASIVELPIGTIMSRLSRARCQLRKILINQQAKEQANAV